MPSPPPDDDHARCEQRINYVHSEGKATNVALAAVKDRVLVVESRLEDHHQSLNSGAERFTRLDAEVSAVKEATRPKWQTVLAVFIPLLGTVGGVIWIAARYPDGTAHEKLQDRVTDIEKANISTDNSLKNITESQARTEKKLDALLMRTP